MILKEANYNPKTDTWTLKYVDDAPQERNYFWLTALLLAPIVIFLGLKSYNRGSKYIKPRRGYIYRHRM